MPSNADLRRAWLLNNLGLSNSTLSNADLENLLYLQLDPYDRRWYAAKGSIGSSLDRRSVANLTIPLVSGRIMFAGVYLQGGHTVTGGLAISGNVAAVTPTNQWMAIYNSDLTKLAVSEDRTTEAWDVQTPKAFAFTPFVLPKSDVYYVGIVVVAATTNNLAGTTHSAVADMTALDASNRLKGQADTGLTNPASAPAVLGTIGSINFFPYFQVNGT